MPQVEILETSELGDRGYVVHDGRTARSPHRTSTASRSAEHGLTCHAWPRRTSTTTTSPAASRSPAHRADSCPPTTISGGRCTTATRSRTPTRARRAHSRATPSTTSPTSSTSTATGPPAVFTGGSLLYGSVGRTDLLGAEHAEELTRDAVPLRSPALRPAPARTPGCSPRTGSAASARRARPAAPPVHAWPGAASNDALAVVTRTRSSSSCWPASSPYPAYYAHMGALNRRSRRPPTWPAASRSTPESCGAGSAGRVGRRPAQPSRLRRPVTSAARVRIELGRSSSPPTSAGCSPGARRSPSSAERRPVSDRPAPAVAHRI